MKSILLILILICVGFISCDGRKSRSESLKSSIGEFKEKHSEVIHMEYYPKEHTEVVTDTLFANNVKVQVKNYSLPDESIWMAQNEKVIPKIEIRHRVFESEVVVSTAVKEIFNTHISAEQFKTVYSDEFWNHATLQHVWVNQELSTSKHIRIDMSFIDPSDNSYKLLRMTIDGQGGQQIHLIEEST